VPEAAVTFALTAPKKTILLAAVELKLVPLITTLVPTGPDTGEKELTVGCAKACIANKDAISNCKIHFIKVLLIVFLRNRLDRAFGT
jgi:hypothetical protein